jgi:hypothetical protein
VVLTHLTAPQMVWLCAAMGLEPHTPWHCATMVGMKPQTTLHCAVMGIEPRTAWHCATMMGL